MAVQGQTPRLKPNNHNRGAPNESRPTPRKERERVRHRLDVLMAAEHLVRQKPYNEIGMKDIAALAEFSVGYLYKLFPNKDELFTSLMRMKLDERQSITKRCVSSPGGVDKRLSNLVEELWAWGEQNIAFSPGALAAFLTLVQNNPRIRQIVREHGQRERHYLTNMFEEGMRDGTIRAGDPQVVAAAFIAIMAGSLLADVIRSTEEETADTTQKQRLVVLETMKQAFVVSMPSSEVEPHGL